MSNMLEQAIVDAEALKEVAIKNAEAAIVEKYSNDIKKAVDQLLEQGPMGAMDMGAPPGTPEALGGMDAGSGEAVGPNVPEAHVKQDSTVTLNLSELVQEMKMDDLDPKEKQVRELVAEEVTGGEEVAGQEGEETITINESVIADILGEMLNEEELEEGEEGEELEEEMRNVSVEEDPQIAGSGWDQKKVYTQERRPSTLDIKKAASGEHGTRYVPGKPVVKKVVGIQDPDQGMTVPVDDPMQTRSESLQRDLQAYQHNYAKLYESHKAYEHNYAQLHQQAGALHEQNNKFRQMLVKTQEKLNEVNVRNAQLHYTNRTLNSDSLNERQKDKVVEAIGKAGTVEEAKIIFETLQSAVAGARPNKETPKSLDEAINKRSSAFLPRKEEKQSDPSFADRMQRLAGIK